MKVHIVRIAGKGVEPERRVGRAEARLAAITIDNLRPGNRRSVRLEGAVVLGSPLQMLGVVRGNRKTLELQRREALVEIDKLGRHAGQQLLAKSEIRRAQTSRSALRRNVGERSTGADDAAIRAEDVRICPGNPDDRVRIGMHPVWRDRVGWQQLPAGVGFVVASQVWSAQFVPPSIDWINARPLLALP